MAIEATTHYMGVREAHRRLREQGVLISINVLYEAIKGGQIPHVKIGRKIFLREDVLAQMEAQTQNTETSAQRFGDAAGRGLNNTEVRTNERTTI